MVVKTTVPDSCSGFLDNLRRRCYKRGKEKAQEITSFTHPIRNRCKVRSGRATRSDPTHKTMSTCPDLSEDFR
jgi:hypothetical protein